MLAVAWTSGASAPRMPPNQHGIAPLGSC